MGVCVRRMCKLTKVVLLQDTQRLKLSKVGSDKSLDAIHKGEIMALGHLPSSAKIISARHSADQIRFPLIPELCEMF